MLPAFQRQAMLRGGIGAALEQVNFFGEPPIVFENPWEVSAYNATYATALSAVADGQYFGHIRDSNQITDVFLRSGAVGIYQGTIPYGAVDNSGPDQAFCNAVYAATVVANTMPHSPLVDYYSPDLYFHANNFKNRAEGAASLNALGVSAPAYLLDNGIIVQDGTMTAIDGHDGSIGTAIRWQDTAGSLMIPVFIPAGQWTFCMKVRRHPGSGAQSCRLFNQAAVTVPDSDSWTEYTYTITLTAPYSGNQTFLRDNGTATYDLDMDDIRCVPGPTITASPVTTKQSFAPIQQHRNDGAIKHVAAAPSYFYMPRSLGAASESAASAVFVIKREEAIGAYGYHSLLSAANNISIPQYPFFGMERFTSYQTSLLQSSSGERDASTANYPRPCADSNIGDGYVVIGFSAGASGKTVWWNGVKIGAQSGALDAFTTRMMQVLSFRGSLNNGPVYASLLTMAYWNTALSDAQMQDACAAAMQRIDALTLAAESTAPFVHIAEGDSNTAGTGAGTYVIGIGATLSPYIPQVNYGIAGHKLSDLVTRLGTVASPGVVGVKINEIIASGYKPLVTAHIGTNDYDLIGADWEGYYTSLKAYWADLRSMGCKIVPCTLIPHTSYDTGSAFEAGRLAMNAQMRLDTSLYDALADTAALDGNMATSELAVSSGYIADNSAHPLTPGYDYMLSKLTPAMQAVIDAAMP